MWHRLTLRIADVPTAMRVFDLLRRLDVVIHGFAARRSDDGFVLDLTCEASAFGRAEDLPGRLAGAVGILDASIAPQDALDLLAGTAPEAAPARDRIALPH